MSFETVAAAFGMSADDLVKVIGAIAMGLATVIGAVGKMLVNLRGARKRLFKKIRRIEDILIEQELKRTAGGALTGVYFDMRDDQRDPADEKDSYS